MDTDTSTQKVSTYTATLATRHLPSSMDSGVEVWYAWSATSGLRIHHSLSRHDDLRTYPQYTTFVAAPSS